MFNVDVEPVVDEAAVWESVEASIEGRPVQGAIVTDADGTEVSSPQPWRIESLGSAGWAAARLAELRARRMEYDEEVRRWREAGAKLVRAEAFFEDALKEWAVRSRTATAKTFTLSHGTVSTRLSKARVVVVDEGAAIGWAEEACPDAVKVSKSFLVSKLGDVAVVGAGSDTPPSIVNVATGEVIPGLSAEPERVSATVKVELPALQVAYRRPSELPA